MSVDKSQIAEVSKILGQDIYYCTHNYVIYLLAKKIGELEDKITEVKIGKVGL